MFILIVFVYFYYICLLFKRLAFSNANVTTDLLLNSIEGEEWFYERIWTPNIFIENELRDEILVTILYLNSKLMNMSHFVIPITDKYFTLKLI